MPVGELVAAQRDERGRDVAEGDFAEMTAVCRLVLNERPNGSEVALMLACDRGRVGASPSSSTGSQDRTASAKPSGRSSVRQSIQDRIGSGVVVQ